MKALPAFLQQLDAERQFLMADVVGQCAWCHSNIMSDEQYVVHDHKLYCTLLCLQQEAADEQAEQYYSTIADVEEERLEHMRYDWIPD